MSLSSLRILDFPSSASSLSRDPLSYIGGTVSELDSLFFAEGEKPYSFAIHESDLREIDCHSALFPFD
jgi:hypothetical protein